MTFILREVIDWSKLVKEAGQKIAAPPMAPMAPPAGGAPAPAPEPMAPPMPGRTMEEGMPVAPGRKMAPNETKPDVAAEPTEYLQRENKEIENAKAIIMQVWGLLSQEAGEGGYDEVKYLLDAIKSLEDFVQVEETGQKPGKGKGKASNAALKFAGMVKERVFDMYEALVNSRTQLLGRPLTDDEETEMMFEATKMLTKDIKKVLNEGKEALEPAMEQPGMSGPEMPPPSGPAGPSEPIEGPHPVKKKIWPGNDESEKGLEKEYQ